MLTRRPPVSRLLSLQETASGSGHVACGPQKLCQNSRTPQNSTLLFEDVKLLTHSLQLYKNPPKLNPTFLVSSLASES
eukprot:g39140.t1